MHCNRVLQKRRKLGLGGTGGDGMAKKKKDI
jgi:hypothetical protein